MYMGNPGSNKTPQKRKILIVQYDFYKIVMFTVTTITD